MKPCSRNRKPIAWLAAGALEARQAQTLRWHLESCEGCRRYFAEISVVTATLTQAEAGSDIPTSESFHRSVVAKLRELDPASNIPTAARTFAARLLHWRMALPAAAVAVVLVAGSFALMQSHKIAPPAAPLPRAAASQLPGCDPDPTVANYQMVANRSLEMLDELLTRQGVNSVSPSPLYSASMSLPRHAAD